MSIVTAENVTLIPFFHPLHLGGDVLNQRIVRLSRLTPRTVDEDRRNDVR